LDSRGDLSPGGGRIKSNVACIVGVCQLKPIVDYV
jgi:hypothetical protein